MAVFVALSLRWRAGRVVLFVFGALEAAAQSCHAGIKISAWRLVGLAWIVLVAAVMGHGMRVGLSGL